MARIQRPAPGAHPAPSTEAPARSPEGRPAPAAPSAARVPAELPRAHVQAPGAEPPSTTQEGLLSRIGRWFQAHPRPVAAVMLGATALPMFVGAPVAHAAENPDLHLDAHEARGVGTEQLEAEKAARDALFGKDAPVETKADTTSTGPKTGVNPTAGGGIVTPGGPKTAVNPGGPTIGPQASVVANDAELTQIGGVERAFPSKRVDNGTLQLAGMHEALLRMMVERQLLPANDGPPPVLTPAQQEDLAVFRSAADGISALMNQSADALPSGVVRDLDRVVKDLLGADVGQAQKALSNALTRAPSLPSGRVDLPGAPRSGVTAPNLAAQQALRGLFDAGDGAAAARAGDVIAAYETTLGSASASIPFLPGFTLNLPKPISYADAAGNRFDIPAGSQIRNAGGNLVVQTSSLGMSLAGASIDAGSSSLVLGPASDQLRFDRLDVGAPGGETAHLVGVTVGVDHGADVASIQAQHATVNLSDGTIRLDQAAIVAGRSADGGSTLGGDAKNLALLTSDGALRADTVSIDIAQAADGSGHTKLVGSGIRLDQGDTHLTATSAVIQSSQAADGSGFLSFLGDDVALTSGETSITTVGASSVTLTRNAAGNLDGASIDAAQITLSDPRGTLAATHGELDLDFDAAGRVTGAHARAQTLNLSGDAGTLSADGGKLDLGFGADGRLESAVASATGAQYTGERGSLAATGGKVTMLFGPDGGASRLIARADSASFTGKAGESITATGGALDLRFSEDGALSRATTSVGRLDATLSDGAKVAVTNGGADLRLGPDGVLREARASVGQLRYTSPDGDAVLAVGDASVRAQYGADGQLSHVIGRAATLDFTDAGRSLSLTRGQLELDYRGDGSLERATGSIGSGSYTGEFGKIELPKGGRVVAEYGADGQLTGARGAVERIDLTNQDGALAVDGGRFDATIGADGKIQGLNVHGDSVLYMGDASAGHALGVAFTDVDLGVVTGADGSQTLDFRGKDGRISMDGHFVSVESVDSIQIVAGADGKIDRMSAAFPGAITVTDTEGDLQVLLQNSKAELVAEGSVLTASFDRLDATVLSQGMTATVQDFQLRNDDRHLSVTIGSASLLQELEKELSVKVEGVELDLSKSATGAVNALDLGVAGLEGRVEGMSVFARTSGGEKIRIHVGLDEAGETVRQMYLQIPSGGEIELSKDDLNVRLGSQRLWFEQSDSGAYRLGADGIDVTATTKDARVEITGGDAAVSLDPTSGRLVIEKIHGTHVGIDVKGQHIDVDIEKLDGFLVKMTGISGSAQGAALHLVPTSDGSEMTLEVRTKVGGIPVKLEFDSVHELEAIGTIAEDQVHVRVADPSGRGTIGIGVGPVKLEGSAIEVLAKYQDYDSTRMLSAVGRFMSKDGIELVKGLTIEPDGVVRLGTTGTGVAAELAVLLPRDTGAPPTYLFNVDGPKDDGAPGAVLSLGGRWNGGNATNTLTAFGGLLPGSYVDWHTKQGTMSLAGVPLPSEMRIPTTGVAGLQYERETGGGTLGLTVGGFVNPAGLAPESSPIRDAVPGGVFGGVRWSSDDVSVGLDAVGDMDRGGSITGGGVRFTLGVRF